MIRAGLTLTAFAAAAPAAGEPLMLRSPDGRVEIVLDQDEADTPIYAVRYRGREVIAPSLLGLEQPDAPPIGAGARRTGAERTSADTRYPIVAGKAASGRDRYNQLVARFMTPAGRPFEIVFRAYDEGAALRYRVPGLPDRPITVMAERTRFAFPADYGCWGLNLGRFGTNHEGEFDPVRASMIREHNLFDAPLLCETERGGPAFALAEADLKGWAGMYLTRPGDGALGVVTRLSPRLDQPVVAVRTRIGQDAQSPWRVIMLGDRAADLIGSTLITSLNPPPAFDTRWIRPGKTAWDWWNGPQLAGVPKPGSNDAAVRGFIDFAAKHKLEYMMVDYGWYVGSDEASVAAPGADGTRPIAAIDLPGLVAYGRERGVGLILWVHWRVIEAQMDEILPLYEKLGVKGIKVDFMDRDDQQMVDFIHRLLAKAARHRLVVDLHGMYHPTGLARTYPNLLTSEGVMGAEYTKWSNRVTATHNVTLPFTRMLLGSMDYTPGAFRNVSPEAFRPEWMKPTVPTTRAHGLAMYVVYESALGSVADSPDVYRGADGFDFVAGVPAAWDETRVIDGAVAEHVSIARRKGADWWLGAMTNDQARTIRAPLAFLGPGRWRATIHRDGATPAAIATETREVTADTVLDLALAKSGGAAARFRRIDGGTRR